MVPSSLAISAARDAYAAVLATATHLVCRDSTGVIWRIKIMKRNEDGTPAPAEFEGPAERDTWRLQFEFVDDADQVVAPMSLYMEMPMCTKGDRISVRYDGWSWSLP